MLQMERKDYGMTQREPLWEPLSLGQVVRSRRLALGLRQQDLADRLDVDQTWVSSVERDYRRTVPGPDEMQRLATALETTIEELMEELGYRNRPDATEPTTDPSVVLFTSFARDLERADLPKQVKDALYADIEWARARAKTGSN